MQIRTATLADVEPVRAVGIASWYDTYTGLVPDAYIPWVVERWWSAADVRRHIASDNFIVLVAEIAAEVVGIAHAQLRSDHTAIVWRLYVAQAYRGRGIGAQLLAAIEARLPADIEQLLLEYYQANTRAAAFYARLGFAFDRVETTVFQGVPIVSIVVRRPVRRGAAGDATA
jgi:GNAT superfamily N-acetyltransferase